MQLGRVCGQVVSTRKTEKLNGFKILVVQPVSLETFEDKGAPFVSLDGVGAGDGELVMCVSGSSSRQTAESDARPIDNLIVAIIDSVDILGTRMFDKSDPSVKPPKKERNDKEKKAERQKTEKKPELTKTNINESRAGQVEKASAVSENTDRKKEKNTDGDDDKNEASEVITIEKLFTPTAEKGSLKKQDAKPDEKSAAEQIEVVGIDGREKTQPAELNVIIKDWKKKEELRSSDRSADRSNKKPKH